METTKIRIDVNQNEAIKLGRKTYGQIDIDIDPVDLTPEQRKTLAAAYKVDGRPFPQRDWNYEPYVGEATIETAKHILDWHASEKKRQAEKEKTEYEAAIGRALAMPIDDFWYDSIYGYGIRDTNYDISNSSNVVSAVLKDPRLADKINAVNARIAELRKEKKEKEDARKALKKEQDEKAAAEKAAAEKGKEEKQLRKKEQIASWVEKNGTDNQKKRLSVNLLPDDEIIDAIRDEAFASMSDFPRYEKLTSFDVDCLCGEYDEKKATFSADDSSSATAEQFDLIEKIKTLLPSAQITLRVHTAYCERCNEDDDVDSDGEIKRYSLKVGLTVGEFYFTREYAV
jgi:hypothetical protein